MLISEFNNYSSILSLITPINRMYVYYIISGGDSNAENG